MRLIDADELLKHKGNCYDINGHLLYAVGTGNIMAAKTIEPKKGKWIADKYTRKCSECESTYWMREGNEWNYCPNCGADMRDDEYEDIPMEYYENGGT